MAHVQDYGQKITMTKSIGVKITATLIDRDILFHHIDRLIHGTDLTVYNIQRI